MTFATGGVAHAGSHGGDHAEAYRVIWGTLEEEGRQLGQVLLSRFSRVRLCATPEMAAHQASLSLGFSRHRSWEEGREHPRAPNKGTSKLVLVAQSCLTLCDPWAVALQAPLFTGFFQARILEWVAISFSRVSS